MEHPSNISSDNVYFSLFLSQYLNFCVCAVKILINKSIEFNNRKHSLNACEVQMIAKDNIICIYSNAMQTVVTRFILLPIKFKRRSISVDMQSRDAAIKCREQCLISVILAGEGNKKIATKTTMTTTAKNN